MSTFHVYRRFLDCCHPLHLTGEWLDLPADDACYTCPRFGTAALGKLADEFLESELVRSGVATSRSDGMVMNPALVGEDNKIVALRRSPDEPPFALMTPAGILPDDASTLLPILMDGRTRQRLNRVHSQLVIGFNVADVTTLRSVNLPAATPDMFSSFTADKLAKLQLECGWHDEPQTAKTALPLPEGASPGAQAVEGDPAPGPEANRAALIPAAPSSPLALILVGWSPAKMSLEQPSGLREMVGLLLKAEQYLNFNTMHIAVWFPTTDDLSRIRFCLEARSETGAARAVTDSLTSSVCFLDAISKTEKVASGEEYGLLKALRERDQALRRGSDGGNAVALWNKEQLVCDAIDRDLVAPLLEWSQVTDNPWKKSLGVTGAGLLRSSLPDLFLTTPLVQESRGSKALAKGTRDPFSGLRLFLEVAREARRGKTR